MIRAISVDMDGTFLDGNGEYDRARFEKIYAELMKRGIKFIVASGNQYYQLKSFFLARMRSFFMWLKMGRLFFIKENFGV